MEKKYKEKNFISAVVYCYNDACIIKEFIENLHKTLSESNHSIFRLDISC